MVQAVYVFVWVGVDGEIIVVEGGYKPIAELLRYKNHSAQRDSLWTLATIAGVSEVCDCEQIIREHLSLLCIFCKRATGDYGNIVMMTGNPCFSVITRALWWILGGAPSFLGPSLTYRTLRYRVHFFLS